MHNAGKSTSKKRELPAILVAFCMLASIHLTSLLSHLSTSVQCIHIATHSVATLHESTLAWQLKRDSIYTYSLQRRNNELRTSTHRTSTPLNP